MQTSPRSGPITLIVVHTNEGPEAQNGALGLANYLHSIDGGYHEIVDNASHVTVAADNVVVWGAGGVNGRAWHICLIGYSAQSSQGWADAYSAGELELAAQRVAAACVRLGIPVVKLDPPQVAAVTPRGICGHGDVSAVYAASQGHTDPGPNFPWGQFIARVQAILHPGPPPPPPRPKQVNRMLPAPPGNPGYVTADPYANPNCVITYGGKFQEPAALSDTAHGNYIYVFPGPVVGLSNGLNDDGTDARGTVLVSWHGDGGKPAHLHWTT